MPELSVNKRALFDYEIAEKFTAGVELTGHEAKSAKSGRMDIAGCHAAVRGNEVFLMGANIQSFQPGNAPAGYDPTRMRKLLLTGKEIKYLIGKLKSGLTLVPLKAFVGRNFIKIELGLGKGRKKADKREVIKKRETEREIRRERK